MNIAGIVKTSCIDFPGRLSAVVFTPGCNYDCPYCHNRHLLGRPRPVLDEGEVRYFLRKRAGMLDGVAVSGGEPTLQKDLCEFLAYAKGLGYETKLDTNGSRPDVIKQVLDLKLADYIAVDYKAPWDSYQSVCGGDASMVEETFRLLLGSDTVWEARTTVFAGLMPDDLNKMAEEAPVLPLYFLQYCREPLFDQTDTTLKSTSAIAYPETELAAIASSLRAVQPNIRVRGGVMNVSKSIV